jgi:prepilin-type N-terminal cleavage/methylation domain-containing protein
MIARTGFHVPRARVAAFTLIEILVVVAILATLGSVAYVAVTNTRESSRVSKLESDVATINAAIQVYKVSGGSLPTAAAPDAILAKLKTSASAGTATSVPGLRSSFVDRRLTTEMQTATEGSSSQERARWDGTNGRFIITTSGGTGVKNFLLDNALAAADPGTENRTPTLKTTDEGWVWDYTDVDPTAGNGPSIPGTAATDPNNSPSAPDALQLSEPEFSQSGGESNLVNFDLSITLTNPNPPGTSQIYYSISGGTTGLYKGQTLTAEPGTSITAFAATIDPDHWANSQTATNTYQAIPVELAISFTPLFTSMTYAQAGGAMTTGTTPPPIIGATAELSASAVAQIPAKYRSDSKFQISYSFGSDSDPLTSGTTGTLLNGKISIPVTTGNWGSGSTLVIKAAARAIDTALFVSSSAPHVSTEIGITQTVLASPTVDPPSGQKAADLPVSIATATGQAYPTGARIYYTLDGSDPGNNNGEPVNGTLYSGQFSSGAGTNGAVVVKARVYGPSGSGQWFTPSPVNTTAYATITTPEGALVGSANLNGTFVGSLVYALPSSGSMGNITFNSGAKILSGNLYLPGTPAVRLSNGTTWSTATDSSFSAHIQGWEYDTSGNKTVQTIPRVINENGSSSPSNYTVSFNKDAILEGKVIRRHNSPAFPVIDAPPPPDGTGSTSLNTHPTAPLNAADYANITLNSTPVGDVRLNAGHYGNLIANNDTAFVLGDPDNPEITQVYSFQSLTLNSAADLKIVGKVIITVAGNINLNTGSVLGDINHPEYLQLQFSSGSMNANSGSAIYGQLVAPTQSVSFNAGSTFQGSVTAQSLTINSNSVVFNLPPIIQN